MAQKFSIKGFLKEASLPSEARNTLKQVLAAAESYASGIKELENMQDDLTGVPYAEDIEGSVRGDDPESVEEDMDMIDEGLDDIRQLQDVVSVLGKDLLTMKRGLKSIASAMRKAQ